MIASLVFLAIAAGAIIWDLTIGFVPGVRHRGGRAAVVPQPGTVAVVDRRAVRPDGAGGRSLAVVVYLVGRWTPALAVVNAVLALAFAIPAIILLAEGQLLNPEFFPTVIPDERRRRSPAIVGVITGFGIAGIALWDIVDVSLKAPRPPLTPPTMPGSGHPPRIRASPRT